MSEFIFVTEKDFSLRAREVIRELGKEAYVILRVGISGPHFPHRDAYPFVRIVNDTGVQESLMAEISADQKELRGYFPIDVKLSGRAEFGYASQVIGTVPIERVESERLDELRVQAKVRRITSQDLGPFENLRQR